MLAMGVMYAPTFIRGVDLGGRAGVRSVELNLDNASKRRRWLRCVRWRGRSGGRDCGFAWMLEFKEADFEARMLVTRCQDWIDGLIGRRN